VCDKALFFSTLPLVLIQQVSNVGNDQENQERLQITLSVGCGDSKFAFKTFKLSFLSSQMCPVNLTQNSCSSY
jgi:hypothetical protein